MVTSPGWGFGLLTGVYLFRTSFKDAPLILASGYSLTCCPWITCSVMRNGDSEHNSERDQALEADRRMLRREIMQFWQGLSEHMDTLEGSFVDEHPSTFHKSLPRLPSGDDAYDDYESDGLITPKGQPSKLPPSAQCFLPPATPLAAPKSLHQLVGAASPILLPPAVHVTTVANARAATRAQLHVAVLPRGERRCSAGIIDDASVLCGGCPRSP